MHSECNVILKLAAAESSFPEVCVRVHLLQD